VRAFALKRRVSQGTQGAAGPSHKGNGGKTSPGATPQWDSAGGMGFGNIVEQAQVLSRRRERLPRVAALVAMHGSSSRRDSHIFWVAYSDHAGGLGGVSLPGRETCLLSTVRPGEQQWDEGSPLPFAGTSMLLSSNHLQAAALALLRHQLNWQTGCLSLKICGCPSCPALCQSMQQL